MVLVLVVVRSYSVVKLTVALKSFGLPEENPVQLFIRIKKPILINDSPFWNLNDQIGYPKGNRSELKIVRKYFFLFWFSCPRCPDKRETLLLKTTHVADRPPTGKPSTGPGGEMAVMAVSDGCTLGMSEYCKNQILFCRLRIRFLSGRTSK